MDAGRKNAEDGPVGPKKQIGIYLAAGQEHLVGRRSRRLCVHRKGATRAFGPGHPALPAGLRDWGQPVLIPGSMGTASWVRRGVADNPAFATAAHGAGHCIRHWRTAPFDRERRR